MFEGEFVGAGFAECWGRVGAGRFTADDAEEGEIGAATEGGGIVFYGTFAVEKFMILEFGFFFGGFERS